MNNVLLLTPMYPAYDMPQVDTQVVHYFAREWVRIGYNVRVVFLPVNFPCYVYWLARPFKEIIGTKTGGPIRIVPTTEDEYKYEDVFVKRIPLTKSRPHVRYSKREINCAVGEIIEYCDSVNFVPDVMISHFVNPQVEIMYLLRNFYKVPCCYVSHDCGGDFESIYKKEAVDYISSWQVIGYRSRYIKEVFEEKFSTSNIPCFMCNSGVPDEYLPKGSIEKDFHYISKFVFVGSLIERKYPSAIIPAVVDVFSDFDFSITFVGDGGEKARIKKIALKYNTLDKIIFTGRVPRNDVVRYLNESQVFIMISERETFGLVYLEAMARGCITIASKNEGIDGVIIDGYNGFLCEAGNSSELSIIIKKIRSLSYVELQEISKNAVATAKRLNDKAVAKDYIENVFNLIKK